MNLKTRNETMVDVSEWDRLVSETYGRPYSFQQQDGCRSRGIFRISVPGDSDDYEADLVPEVVNHEERGVSFAAWLKRDPEAPLANGDGDFSLGLWWGRNFYPDIQMVANDLVAKNMLKAGNYTIDIDW